MCLWTYTGFRNELSSDNRLYNYQVSYTEKYSLFAPLWQTVYFLYNSHSSLPTELCFHSAVCFAARGSHVPEDWQVRCKWIPGGSILLA